MSDSDFTKRCTKCTKVKPRSAFSKDNRAKSGLQQHCKECNRAYYRANSEKVKQRVKKHYRENHGHYLEYEVMRHQRDKEKRLAGMKRYRDSNPKAMRQRRDRYRAENRETILARKAAYREANRIALRLAERQRQYKRLASENPCAPEEIEQMYEDQGGLCAYCEAPLEMLFHMDHMLPLSRGGTHAWENIAITCPRCNLRKSAKTAEEFMAYLKQFDESLALASCGDPGRS